MAVLYIAANVLEVNVFFVFDGTLLVGNALPCQVNLDHLLTRVGNTVAVKPVLAVLEMSLTSLSAHNRYQSTGNGSEAKPHAH